MALETFAFTDRAIQIIAEDKIQTAIRNGLFDNLPDLDEPFSCCDESYDSNWWIRGKLKEEKLTRPAMRR